MFRVKPCENKSAAKYKRSHELASNDYRVEKLRRFFHFLHEPHQQLVPPLLAHSSFHVHIGEELHGRGASLVVRIDHAAYDLNEPVGQRRS